MSTTDARDEQLLQIGKKCSHSQCSLVDYLPFKCQHCGESFCQEHYRVEGHACPKYDQSKHDRVAPNCPLCNVPVAVPPGQDPNIRMDRHLEWECVVVTGRVKAKSTPTCQKINCSKVLFSPIRCDSCRSQFCANHRFPSDHSCNGTFAVRKPTGPPRPTIQARANSTSKDLNAKASVKVAEVASALETAKDDAKAKLAAAGKAMPFNKTDRRSLLSQPLIAVQPTMITDNKPSTTIDDTPSPTNTLIQPNAEPPARPPPIINPLASFIPPPIFATA